MKAEQKGNTKGVEGFHGEETERMENGRGKKKKDYEF